VIISACRTAIGTARKGSLTETDPFDLGSHVVREAMSRSGVDAPSIDDVILVATTRLLEIDPEIVNPNGSGCSLGHPIAMTGARKISRLLYELRRRGGGIGVAAMCAGGGMSAAVVIEV
jgi:acetyl-CoA C-acetyltransferase